MTRCCSQCGSNGHNTRTCNSAVVGGGSAPADDSSSVGTGGSAEIVLFGVRVKVDPMRKSVSMNNLSQYEQPPRPLPDQPSNNSSNLDVSAAAAAVVADTGYASADDAGRQQSSGSRERKRGIPWTEDEHKRFLSGLQKVGKGDWRGISRNFVRTRTPTQVASHAQKYFLRRSNLNRRRRRSSLFDITTDDVTATPMEEQQIEEDNSSQQALAPPQLPSQEISPLSGFPLAPFAPTIAPVLQPVQTQTPMEQENITFGKGIPVNNGPTVLVYPIPVVPTYSSNASSSSSSAAAMPDLNLNLNSYPAMDAPQLSLNLSLSYDQNNKSSQRRSAFQVISSFKNGDSIISVA